MRVLVTGGSGQLGTVLIRRLVADRTVTSVVSIDLRPSAIASRKLSAVVADVRAGEIADHMQGCEAVFHLAYLVTVPVVPEEYFSVNVGGSRNVFEAAQRAGVKSLVYCSSVAAYGVVAGHPNPIVEESPRRYQPSFPYAATKFEVEAFLDGFEAAHPEMAIARLRPAILAGERMDHALGDALRRRFVPEVRRSRSHPGRRGSNDVVPLVWDEDVADAAIRAWKRRARGAFNLAADEPLSLGQLAAAAGMRHVVVPRTVAQSVGRLAELLEPLGMLRRVDPSWLAETQVPLRVSSDRAKAVLEWRPRFPKGVDVARRLGQTATGTPDPRIALFMRLVSLAARNAPRPPDAERTHARIHLAVTGRGGSDFTVVVDAGRLSIESGAPRPPTSVLTVPTRTLLDLLSGSTTTATAQLTGKLRIEGEPMATMVLTALVNMFRAAAGEQGARAWPARSLSRWMARGAEARGAADAGRKATGARR